MFDDVKLVTFTALFKKLSIRIALSNSIVMENEIIARVKSQEASPEECSRVILPVRDALDVLNGRWKLAIIISLSFGTKRFSELSKEIGGITDKVLSKELKELETFQLITRTVHNGFPPSVDYSITEHGNSLHILISGLRDWGEIHRKKIMGK